MKFLVIIPTFNELENIETISGRVLAADRRFEVLFVDDNSPDGTGRLADRLAESNRRIHVIHREKKLGLGTAYITGFKYAVSRSYDLVFEMDADLSHDPVYLPGFLEQIRTCDLVLGSRYLDGVNVVNWPLHRLLLSYFANFYARVITGVPVRDLTSGYKCFRREVLEAINLDRIRSQGYAFQIEMNFICWKKKYKIREVPIVFVDRSQGRTKMTMKNIIECVWIVWKLRILGMTGSI